MSRAQIDRFGTRANCHRFEANRFRLMLVASGSLRAYASAGRRSPFRWGSPGSVSGGVWVAAGAHDRSHRRLRSVSAIAGKSAESWWAAQGSNL